MAGLGKNKLSELYDAVEYRRVYDDKTGKYKTEVIEKEKRYLWDDVDPEKELDKLYEQVKSQVTQQVKGKNTDTIKKEEIMSLTTKKGTKRSFLNGEFGQNADPNIALSMSGQVAYKRGDGVFATYDNGELTEVIEDFTLNADGMFFNMPVTKEQLKAGDLILDNGKPLFVAEVTKDGKIKGVDPVNATNKSLVNVKNMFGFNFYTKVVSLFNMNGQTEGVAGFNPMMLMLMGDGDSKLDVKSLMLMQMASGQGGGFGGAGFNPMMLLALGKDGNNDELFKMMAFSQMMPQQNGGK